MLIQKFKSEFKQDLENLINSIYEKEVPLYVLSLDTVVVAFEDDQMVGFAAYRRRELHDRVVTLEIGVIACKRRRGVGASLHEELFTEFPLKDTDIGTDGCCYSSNTVAQSFLISLGYLKYLDCNCLILDLEQNSSSSKELSITSLIELYQNDVYRDKVKEFYISRYTTEHKWSPVTTNTVVWDDYYDDGNSLDLGVALLKDRKIIGCSFAYENFGEEAEDESDDLLGIGGTYALSNNIDEELDMTKNILSHQFDLAKMAGHKEAYIEVDSTEATSEKILKWLPIKRRQVFERYRLSK
jgi:hypothetical protein